MRWESLGLKNYDKSGQSELTHSHLQIVFDLYSVLFNLHHRKMGGPPCGGGG